MISRRLSTAVLAAGLVIGAVVVGAPAANAYPPGTAMALTSSPLTTPTNTYVALTASHVKPGCRVTFSAYGSSSKYATANGSGEASVNFKFSKSGTVKARATTSDDGGCGHESATVNVTVYGAPSAPSDLKKSTVTKNSIRVTWKSPCSCGGLPLKWWTVTLRDSRGGFISSNTTTNPYYTLSGLKRYTYYKVSVRATNTAPLTGEASTIRVKTAS